MPAVATIEDLRAVDTDLRSIKETHPDAYEDVVAVFRRHRKVGYKNLCKIMMGEATPEKLKGLE